MRITKVLLIGFAVVAAPGLLGSGWVAWNAWQGLQRAQGAEAVAEALRTSMQAQTLLAEESADLSAAALTRRGDARMLRQAANLTHQRIEAVTAGAAAAGLAVPDRGLVAGLDALRQRVVASATGATGSGAPDTALSQAVLRARREAIAELGFRLFGDSASSHHAPERAWPGPPVAPCPA
ncbi:hypothetical protein GXW71_29870 [Roseomonas hellenica]|uniref:Uncharacterized protein n=1 Tax=Plastoroseomonas hellenica TaxID=2687306 RepID=A0ABS5F7S6_9PROT|nr:hypothetical protein [Plastoroseomonas hellenica]MBR0668597.1 hypothetical protein [Plastoroseomonas hellenica]